MTCAFKPSDVFYKNISLLPEPMDTTDRYQHLPNSYKEEQSEKLLPQLKFDIGKSENISSNGTFGVKKILDDITNNSDYKQLFSDKMLPSSGDIAYMFNLKENGISTFINFGDISFSPSFLEKETAKIPVLNNFPGVSQLYNKQTPVVENIKDINVPGLDDVLPTNVGRPLKTDVDSVNLVTFSDFITPDKVIFDSDFTDLIP